MSTGRLGGSVYPGVVLEKIQMSGELSLSLYITKHTAALADLARIGTDIGTK